MRVVLMAGGMGTRLWPISRRRLPKQFIPGIFGGSPLSSFQSALTRVDRNDWEVVVVCPSSLIHLAKGQAKELHNNHQILFMPTIIEEKQPQGTLNAAMLGIEEAKDEELILVMSCDQFMDFDAFQEAVKHAELHAKNGSWVIFGTPVDPSQHNPGFGHFRFFRTIPENGHSSPISYYQEKPDNPQTLPGYPKGWYWNAGMFMFRKGDYWDMFQSFPDRNQRAIDRITEIQHAGDRLLMGVVMWNSNWVDIGSWGNLWEKNVKDEGMNVVEGRVMNPECKRSYLYSKNLLMVGIGLEDIVAVAARDAILIMKRGEQSNQILSMLAKDLSEKGLPPMVQPVHEMKPWGAYEVLEHGLLCKVKNITISPGKQTSLQYHLGRTEYLLVVSGVMEVVGDEGIHVYKEGGTAVILPGKKHRLRNPGKKANLIVEVQKSNGPYLDEADVVRVEDDYGREEKK